MGLRSKKSKRRKTKKKRVALRKVADATKKSMLPSNNTADSTQSVVFGTRKAIRNVGGKVKIVSPQIFHVYTKLGGILPLIPVFAGLTINALGAVTSGVPSVEKVVNNAKSAREQLSETQRYNRTIEEIAL